MDYQLEIIGFNIKSCLAAQQNGAHRIELCASPGEGGTTPSYSFIKRAKELLRIPVYVMIRPRGGDFLYSADEFKIMTDEISICKQLDCDGVVLGILKEDGTVDIDRCKLLVEHAYPMGVTFHRAFDRVCNPVQALEDVIATGCERILTSGLHPKAEQGKEVIADLIRRAEDRIIIMPGSGVNAQNIQAIIKETGAREIHSSASVTLETKMKYENPEMKEHLSHVTADGGEVRKMSLALSEL